MIRHKDNKPRRQQRLQTSDEKNKAKKRFKNGSKSSPFEFNKRRAYGFDETGPWNGNGHKRLRFLYYSSLINKDSSLMLRETTGGLPDLFLLLTHGLGVSSGQCVGTYGRDDVGSVSCGWLHDGSVIIGAMADRRIYLWSLYGTEIEHELEQKQREQNNNKIQQF
ncbi:unnamed protein product [Brassica oleracea var. botrytis]|nr:unnamed protein product [Brassica napus]